MIHSATAPRGGGRRWLERFGIGLFELMLRPERYLRRAVRRSADTLPWVLISLVGLGGFMDNLSVRITFMQAMGRTVDLESLQWISVWPGALVLCLPLGAVAWLLWGWWYRVRLRFCGAKDVDKRQARLVWIHARSVAAVPMALWLVVTTVRYDNYLEAWSAGSLDITFLALEAWAIFVGWRGAITCFPVNRTAALWWFLIVPIGFFGLLIAIGIGSVLVAMLI